MTRTTGRRLRIAAVLIGIAFLAAACSSDKKTTSAAGSGSSSSSAVTDCKPVEAAGPTTTAAPTTTAPGATTAPPTTAGKPGEKGALEGLRGTTPLVDLGADFKKVLDCQGLDLKKTYNYGAEAYDATTIIALAAAAAKTDGLDMANQINGVTRGGTKCKSFKECNDLLKAGTTDIDYDGVSGPLEFSGNGEPTIASYGVQEFVATDHIDDAKTVFKIANAPKSADVPNEPATGTRAGDGVLKIGTLLPETGSLAFLGPPERAGVRAAVADINKEGGVLGKPVAITEGDSSDAQNPTVSQQTVDRELAENVDAIVGPASSSVALGVIDKVTSAGVVFFSPANTSKKLSTYPDKGLYFRDAPSDILQGQVLGEVIAADGVNTIGLLVLNDAYGTGLAEDLTKSFEASGGKVVISKIYDPKAQTFDSEVDAVKAQNPDGIVIIGFDESSRLLNLMVQKGVGPKDKKVYGVDGNMGNTLGDNFDAGK